MRVPIPGGINPILKNQIDAVFQFTTDEYPSDDIQRADDGIRCMLSLIETLVAELGFFL